MPIERLSPALDDIIDSDSVAMIDSQDFSFAARMALLKVRCGGLTRTKNTAVICFSVTSITTDACASRWMAD